MIENVIVAKVTWRQRPMPWPGIPVAVEMPLTSMRKEQFLAISLYIRYNIEKFGIDRLREHSLPLNNNFA